MKWHDDEVAILQQYSKGKKSPYQLYVEIKALGNGSAKRTYDSVARKINRMILNNELLKPKNPNYKSTERIGYLDIEASGLNADFGYMISWCIKERDKKIIHKDYIKRSEILNYTLDKRIVKSLINTMKQFDRIVTYYGTGFDMKFIFSRAKFWKIPFPPYGTWNHTDLYYQVKNKFKIRSNRLATVTEFLGIKGKTPLSPDAWIKGQLGHPQSISYIVHHNEKDVEILEKTHKIIETHSKNVRKPI